MFSSSSVLLFVVVADVVVLLQDEAEGRTPPCHHDCSRLVQLACLQLTTVFHPRAVNWAVVVAVACAQPWAV